MRGNIARCRVSGQTCLLVGRYDVMDDHTNKKGDPMAALSRQILII
jgi:hypothetical protein